MALELFGYLGSVLILISMLMTSVVRLRVINLIGSVVFTAYAVLIGSYPTAFLNGCLVLVNIYHLMKLRSSTGHFYEVQPLCAGDGLTDFFLRRYGEDMRQFFPGLDFAQARSSAGFSVFYGDQIAGLMLGSRSGAAFDVLLDYTATAYRDCSVGTHLYAELPSHGISRLSARADSPAHAQYLEKMGFVREADGSWTKALPSAEEASA